MSRIFKDMYFELFSVKPWSSFNVSGASQPQKWQWLSSCSASRCPGVRLGTGGQILDSVRALVKFHQLTDGWGPDSHLQIWILVICYLTFDCFFSLLILSLHFLYTFSPLTYQCTAIPGCYSESQCSGANPKPWKPRILWSTLEIVWEKRVFLLLSSSLLCVNSLPKEQNTE